MESIYQSGVCTWPDCGLPFINYEAFSTHLHLTHKLNDNSAGQAQGQMQVVEELVSRLQHEKDRLTAMIEHLQEERDRKTAPTHPHHPDRLYYRDANEKPPYALTSLVRNAIMDTKTGRSYTYHICEWLKRNFAYYRNKHMDNLIRVVENVLHTNKMFTYAGGFWMVVDEGETNA